MTVYANLVDGDLKGVYDLLPPVWNSIANFNTKAQADEAFMKENGFVKIVRDTTVFNSETHKMSDFPWYTVENGMVIEHRDILEIPPSETEPTSEPEPTA
jgi:hypothetical protein